MTKIGEATVNVTISEKERLRAAKEMALEQARGIENEIERDSRSLVLVSGLAFDPEMSDQSSLDYETMAQSFVRARIDFHREQLERWDAFIENLIDRLDNGDN